MAKLNYNMDIQDTQDGAPWRALKGGRTFQSAIAFNRRVACLARRRRQGKPALH